MVNFSYHIYGINISSDLDLPGLPETDQHEDVIIKHSRTTLKKFQNRKVSVGSQEIILELPPIGIFTVRQGREIMIELCQDANLDLVRSYLIGTVLGVLLHQRGYLVLHASCMSIEGQACLFAGQVGSGKSTFASHMLLAGAKLLADDITAIKMVDGVLMVQPGFPMMRLKPENAEVVFGSEQRVMPKQIAKFDKQCYLVDSFFEYESKPLKHIYLLQYGVENSFNTIHGTKALLQCMPHLFVCLSSSIGNHASIFQSLASILPYIGVYQFTRIHGLENIPENCTSVIKHIREISQTGNHLAHLK